MSRAVYRGLVVVYFAIGLLAFLWSWVPIGPDDFKYELWTLLDKYDQPRPGRPGLVLAFFGMAALGIHALSLLGLAVFARAGSIVFVASGAIMMLLEVSWVWYERLDVIDPRAAVLDQFGYGLFFSLVLLSYLPGYGADWFRPRIDDGPAQP